MDQQELIDRITSEVMKTLSEKGEPTVTVTPATGQVCPPECINCYLCVTNNPAAVKTILNGGADRVSSTIGIVNVPADVAKYIDHTLLKPDATREQYEQLCDEAAKYGFYSVCVNSFWIPFCARRLRGKDVKVCSVVGFPLGAMDSRSKGFETRNAIESGASEIDMVVNVGALKSGDLDVVEEDIRAVSRACRSTTVLKVIIETCLLTDDEKVTACRLAMEAGVQFVKTSTGLAGGGATVDDVRLMRRTVGSALGVKAAGGIRTCEDAQRMIDAGANRIGTSAGVAIVT